jgi:Domain of unknown function (DUF4126)
METYLFILPSLLLGIALSACAGFRIFVPLLVTNLATKFGLFHVASNFAWLSSNTASIILIVAVVAEITAYYIPVVDNLLDTLATPASFVAGTILTTSFLQIHDPVLQWGLGMIAGGGVAGTIQAGTSLLRLGSTKLTGGTGNSVLASTENGISIGFSLLSLLFPMLVGVGAVLLFVYILKRILTKKQL